MALFQGCSVLFELRGLPFKEKQKIKLAVTDNGGLISFVVNKECSLIVTSDVSSLSHGRLRNIVKHQIPVVGLDYVHRCVEADCRLALEDFQLDISSTMNQPSSIKNKWSGSTFSTKPSKSQNKPLAAVSTKQSVASPKGKGSVLDFYRLYKETDSDLPKFPENFQVAKYGVFQRDDGRCWSVLELQSAKDERRRKYRVVRYWMDDVLAKKPAVRDHMMFMSTSEEALKVFQLLADAVRAAGLNQEHLGLPQALEIGSAPLHELLLEERLHTEALAPDVGDFVELLWTEALGCTDRILNSPVHKISLNDVTRAEGILLQLQRRIMQNNNDNFELQSEYFTLLPQKVFVGLNISSISKQFDLCQLIRDILNVSEMTLGSTVPSSLGKYRALRCSIENVPKGDSEFEAVTSLLQHSKAQVHQILRVNRAPEVQSFKSDLGGIKTLLHSSKPHNFVGILSRGLLMPCVAVSHHGIQRTDAGDLGSGIYFSDDINTTWKFSQCSQTDGSRLILVCEVALGRCKDLHNKDQTLTQAPEGHDSVHGVRNTPGRQSEFTDDEYVVYSPDQVKIKYVVRLSLEGEKLKTFTPKIVQSEKQPLSSPPNQGEGEIEDGIADIKNPLDNVTAGLLNSSGQQIPLQAVHVKCKLVDLLAQVIIFQKYTNESSAPIEAKYVFPLDDSAAVCGFEAFINGKHVVGQVKEKEAARREYKQAVEKGHGAYLMDQDAPDVFTISVGNLPAGATVLIKVTFVSELIVKDGSIFFSLPSSVAPWQESAALNQTTQATVKKVCVTDEEANSREFNLDMSVEMPHKITDVKCITHQIKIKKTDCKAVVRVLPGEVMGPEGFQLLVTLTEVHVPRMWVEKHPDKDSQACMLVFYPNFDTTSPGTADEVVLLLDASQSMKGESLNTARTIALQILKTLENNVPVNVIFFGTDHKDAFISAKPINEARQEAKNFIKNFSSVGGSTELWRPLRALSLLPPSSGTRNLLLLSDGHIQNPEVTLKLLRDNTTHTRLFTCGLSATANRHMLRAMAQAGGGAYEFFDSKSKHTWSEKVAAQVKRMQAPGASSVSVKWQQFNPTAPAPVQAPKQLHALFNNCHTLVFGFVPHCTKATLLGKLSGQEIETMVSTSELQKTKGTFLHKLTARAIIRDFEDGSLDSNAVVHEEKKAELKSFVIELSKEFSILSQFTSFVAIEERDSEEEKGFTDVPKLIAEEDVDFLPYMSWASEDDSSDRSSSPEYDSEDSDFDYKLETCSLSPETKEGPVEEEDEEEMDEWISDEDMGFSLFDDDTTESASREMQKESSLAFTAMECEDDFSDVPTILKSDQKSKKLKLKLRKSALLESDCLRSASPSPMEVELVFPKLKKARKDLIKDYDKSYQPPPPPPPPAGRISVAPGTVGSGLMMGKKMSSAPAPSFPPPVVGLSASPSQQIGFLRSTAVDLSPESLPETDQAYSHCPLSFPLAASLTPQQDHTLSESQFPSSPSYVPTSPSFSLPPFKGMETPAAPPSFSFGSAAGQPKPLSFESFSVEPVQYFVPPHRMSVSSQPAPPVKAKLDIFPSQEQTAASLLSFPFGSSLVEAKNEKAGVIREMEKAPRVTRGRPVMQCGFFPLQSEMKQGSELQPKPLHAAQRGSGHFLAKLVSQCADQEMQGSAIRRSGMRFGHSLDTRESKWPKIYSLQHQDGYWEITPELGMLLNCDISRFAEDFLKRKGIVSLGKKAHTEILRLLATLLVLQLMRLEKLREGQLLRTLFCLEESKFRPVRWAAVNRAVEWARWADREYPCVYSRLEFGLSWDSSTKQLLGAERFHQCSPLIGLNLNPRPTVIL